MQLNKDKANLVKVEAVISSRLANFLPTLNQRAGGSKVIGKLIETIISKDIEYKESVYILRHMNKSELSKDRTRYIFYLSPETVAILKKLSRMTGLSKGQCIDWAIEYLVPEDEVLDSQEL
jgi:hypothetical protein